MNDKDNKLSQEEIDALMKSDDNDIIELTAEEIDVFGEIGNIAMGASATALHNLLEQRVEITTPEVKVTTMRDITKEYKRPCVLVKVEFIAGLEGANFLIINEADAKIIADLMMGGDGTEPAGELDEIKTSAVGEAMNQMMGSASTSLSSILNEVVNISPPETKYLNINDAFNEEEDFFQIDEPLVATSFNLKIGSLIDSSFKQLSPFAFTKQLISSLADTNYGGLIARDEQVKEEDIQEIQVSNQEIEEKISQTERQEVAASVQQEVAATASNNMTYASINGSNNVAKKEGTGVQRVQFPSFDQNNVAPLPHNMELIQDVPLQVTVQLGKSRMTIKEVLDLGEGSVIELDKLAGEPVDLLVNGKLIAKGEIVVIDENFGFRVKDIISPMERINNI